MSIATKIIQYNTNGATFSVQKQLVITTVSTGYVNIEAGGGGGVTAHGALTGLGNDDHTQYHNDARGDIRYYTKTELDAGQLDTRYYTEAEVAAGYQPLDSVLTGTTASFTIALESKLNGIAAGAEVNVNVNADWNSVSGDSEILNKPATFPPSAHTHVLADVTNVTMTAANLNSLDNGANSTLHFHDSDRSRANHTGTQTASTISDFNTASDARIAAATGVSVQAFDADLSALSALSGTDTIYYRSGASTWSPVTIGANITFSGGTLSAASGGGNSVTTVVSFGASFTDSASTVVTGQSWVASGSEITAQVVCGSGVDPLEVALLDFKIVISDLVAGVGFTVTLYSMPQAKGDYSVMCIGV